LLREIADFDKTAAASAAAFSATVPPIAAPAVPPHAEATCERRHVRGGRALLPKVVQDWLGHSSIVMTTDRAELDKASRLLLEPSPDAAAPLIKTKSEENEQWKPERGCASSKTLTTFPYA
jgi:hypothetical protein